MPSNDFLGVFAKSPLKPLEEHVNVVFKCSQKLLPFFEAVFEENWGEARTIQRDISALEKEADDLKRQLRLNTPSGIFMPIQRNDLLDLLTHQDRIANLAKDVSGRVIGRELAIPEVMKGDFIAFLNRCLDATQQAKKVINELDDLLETGFRGRELSLVEKMIEELDSIEDDTDYLQIKLREQLYKIEDNLKPVDVMFLYQIIARTGSIADEAERVGSRLEIMLAK